MIVRSNFFSSSALKKFQPVPPTVFLLLFDQVAFIRAQCYAPVRDCHKWNKLGAEAVQTEVVKVNISQP